MLTAYRVDRQRHTKACHLRAVTHLIQGVTVQTKSTGCRPSRYYSRKRERRQQTQWLCACVYLPSCCSKSHIRFPKFDTRSKISQLRRDKHHHRVRNWPHVESAMSTNAQKTEESGSYCSLKKLPQWNLALLGKDATTESLSTCADSVVPKTTTTLSCSAHGQPTPRTVNLLHNNVDRLPRRQTATHKSMPLEGRHTPHTTFKTYILFTFLKCM